MLHSTRLRISGKGYWVLGWVNAEHFSATDWKLTAPERERRRNQPLLDSLDVLDAT